MSRCTERHSRCNGRGDRSGESVRLSTEKAAAAEQMRRTETMGAYKPSTLLDFESGRPLEIEAIWGEPFRRAAAAGAQTPRLQMIYSLLKSLDGLRQNGNLEVLLMSSYPARDGCSAITIRNLQRSIRVNLADLQRFAEQALNSCRAIRRKGVTPLTSLGQISVLFISDRRMAALHQRFLKTAGPTDVITFEHGEIFISVETARRHARRFGTSLAREIKLYIVHALLHLHGFDDKKTSDARRMEGMQSKILGRIATG